MNKPFTLKLTNGHQLKIIDDKKKIMLYEQGRPDGVGGIEKFYAWLVHTEDGHEHFIPCELAPSLLEP